MKKITKLFAVVLSTAMIVASFAGCGNTAKGGETWKIGGIGPNTGGAAVYGIAVQNGADLAIKEINEAGGINGFKIDY